VKGIDRHVLGAPSCSPALRDTSDAKSLTSSPLDFAVSAA
jgi:hypothetical protein